MVIPTAIEMRNLHIIKNVVNHLNRSVVPFIDCENIPEELEALLVEKGFTVDKIVYERIDGKWGFHGNITYDNTVGKSIFYRVSWCDNPLSYKGRFTDPSWPIYFK